MVATEKVIIIAEAGVNHNGKTELAYQLVEEAAQTGVDFVKFQSFQAEKLLCLTGANQKADSLSQEIIEEQKTFAMLKGLELSYTEQEQLYEHCKSIGIGFLSTPFDAEAIGFLAKLDLSYWKIASGDITNLPYLRAIAQHPKPVLLSTGMSNLADIEGALEILTMEGGGIVKEDITILHCNSAYPTPFADANLRAIQTLRNAFGTQVGYSDHTPSIEAAIAAVSMGACVIEKHFTLDQNMPGPDHKASLEPEEFKRMVKAIRNIEQALGDGIKQSSASEKAARVMARRSIVAACEIKKDEVLTEANLTTKRPGKGVSPMLWNKLVGTPALRDYAIDEVLEFRI